MEEKKIELSPKNTISIILIVSAAVAAFVIAKKLGLIKSKSERELLENADEKIYDQINQNTVTSKKTLTDAQITSMCNAIKKSWGFFNDNEAAIYSQFSKLNNIYDVYALISQYGLYKGRTLEEDLRSRMSNKEIEHINSILTTKSINFSF